MSATPPVLRSALLEPFSNATSNAAAPTLRYGFTTRQLPQGGLAEAWVGGQPPEGTFEAHAQQVEAHRQAWLAALGMSTTAPLRYTVQVHGTASFCTSSGTVCAEADAIVVDTPHAPAMVLSADCTPVILYAPQQRVGAVVHAGWKGTALGVAAVVAQRLVAEHAVPPQELLAVMGPALSADGFEIGEEVLQALEASLPTGTPLEAWAFWDKTTRKWHANVPQVNALQLQAVGVLPQHTECLAAFSDKHPAHFWSFRRGHWQRQGTLLQLL
jgi:YfiH family protein